MTTTVAAVKDTPSVHIRGISEAIPICENHLHGVCTQRDLCDYHHYTLPYLWQIEIPGTGWCSAMSDSQVIEKLYCDILPDCQLQFPITAPDGRIITLSAKIDFNKLEAHLTWPVGIVAQVRRLSTDSYVKVVEKYGTDAEDARYHTQWRWYWWSNAWKPFNEKNRTPQQYTLESKFLSQQDIYRFAVQEESSSKSCTQRSTEMVFMLNFMNMKLMCLNDKNCWTVIRRPLFVGKADIMKGKYLENPPIQRCSFLPTLPDNWYPIDTSQYELIPLNPESMAYHLVASEFYASLSTERRKIHDIFRVQNPFLWNQFTVRKKLMEREQKVSTLERQLFHGTSDDSIVQAICRDNFDWRVCGKNNTVYGKGSYFARNAAFSDKYTRSGAFVKWMFLARVLVGRYTKGNSSFVRPPPLDAAFPHGELYDSCVDKQEHPMIFVVFERDQCYPEYLISYQ